MPIDRLIVVAGPKAVGKSHFIESLRQRSLPDLTEAIQMDDPASWQYVAALEYEDEESRAHVRDARMERVVLHYEMTRPWARGYARSFSEDTPLELFRFSKEITVVTLWAPCNVLLSRFLARNSRFRSKLLWLRAVYRHGFQIRKLDSDFRPLYRNPKEVVRVYKEWFQFCGSHAAKGHWLVASRDEGFSPAIFGKFPDDLVETMDAWDRASDGV